ncbi:DUF1131 family protein [Stappia sp. ES.058]|uniref:DUF1131 family protein n=1 Tax=Stappia sp. ES.058 TaxID=1881061 RepID=UPI00087DD60E|nr:DUF1131 family protein [Stappia sp. ES.058]SDT97936.1 Protein of unknown function [Stappia sp. ES.058]
MRLFQRFLPVLMASVLTGACSPTLPTGPVSVARTSNITLVKITDAGAGGITSETVYSEKSVEQALPGFSAEGFQSAIESKTEWAIGAFNSDGFQVLQVYKGRGGKVRAVHGVTHHLQGPNGERIGMTFAEVGTSRGDCRVGRSLWRGMAICKADGSKNVTLVYAISQYDGPFDRLPPSDQLRQAAIQRIIWTAP